MTEDIYHNLNPQQKKAVCYNDGPLLVLAGAGSGKTRILTTRIIHLIRNGLRPTDIMAVTFTNKAANEMRKRIEVHGASGVSIGTFHSICLRILRRYASRLGYRSDFTIYDDQDQLAIIKECMKEQNVDPKQVNPKGVREFISQCKDALVAADSSAMRNHDNQMYADLYGVYAQKLMQYNGMDFGDLIYRVVRLFEICPEIALDYRRQYQHVLVDEYQDTNHAQYMFIKAIAQGVGCITVVGDPDQSIYEWRGASIENIMKFESDFEGAAIIRLEQNYRSTNNILNAANAVIAHNLNRKSKNLWSDKGNGDKIALNKSYGERSEARYVVNTILKLLGKKYKLNQIVGFYRTHAQSRVIEEELMRHQIPYRIVGGLKFYARKEIKDLLAFLKVIHNPGDEVSLMRIINVPKKGVGPGLIRKVREVAISSGLSVYAAIPVYVAGLKTVSKGAKSLHEFYKTMERLRATSQTVRLVSLLEAVLHDTGYEAMLALENTIESRTRLENIRELAGAMQEFQESVRWQEDVHELQSYLEFISLQTAIDGYYEDDQSFTMMTLHGAKGLEFPVVFMLGMEEGLLPHSNAVNSTERELEEERRLCYVGFTRAMERLYLSYTVRRKLFGVEKLQTPSRFLYEIPAEFLVQPMEGGTRWSGDVMNEPFEEEYPDSEPAAYF